MQTFFESYDSAGKLRSNLITYVWYESQPNRK